MVDTDADLSDYDIWTLIALLTERRQSVHWDTRAAVIRERLERGADPNAGRCAPLTTAAAMGHLEIVELLLEFGADVHGGCNYQTPLTAAVDYPAIKARLLESGAKETLFTMIAEGDKRRIETHLTKDASAVHVRDEADMTPLCIAAGRLDIDTMKLLLDVGADPNVVAERSYGVSPIHGACGGGDRESSKDAIDLLVRHGAKLDAQNKGGVTALHMAVRDRNVAAVRALLSHGANPGIEDRGRKSTPLRRAVANTGRPGTSCKADAAFEITRMLLESGADPRHVNRSGKTVIQSTRSPEIRALLEAAIEKRRR